ncbi:hypothetical protein EJ05DRAFT_150398 [Pseudovirgaria hyperparasitica]|uniref:DUF7721 domain-containing protein n=1 Tax=Pseudovirgaria hyperparasitica TaxID=470096 RepID=A0A6A6VTY0_9PEZI|nr:uncharacterized protein EJ05DRAFT_150398 [Pseudovirgaria hyperparasitica]KAF2754148.1 hypothetical protein EJ05DRAFT_150398 [Pseudovirgaria hyperparasitica]
MSYNDNDNNNYGGRQGGGHSEGRQNEYGDRRNEDSYGGGRQEEGFGGGRDDRQDYGGGNFRGAGAGGRGQADDFEPPRQGGRQGQNDLYGGGGQSGDNYYDSSKRFDDNSSGRHNEGPMGSNSGTSYSGGGYGGDNNEEYSGAAHQASQHAGDSGDSSLFSSALGMLSGKKQQLQNEDVDEDDAVRQHQNFYGQGNGNQQASAGNLGAAAAMQALKMYNGGQGQSGHGSSSQSNFIGMAMGQAAKLFDQQSAQGNTHPQATKQDAVAQAAQMALKFYMKSEMGGSGGSSGSGLLGLASKFLK